MGRPKKINNNTGKPFRSDRELVEQFQINLHLSSTARKDHTKEKYQKLMMAAATELWEKYFLLRMKMRAQLAKVVRDNNLYYPELYEEYDGEAWDKFINQMDGIRLDDVAHLPNWSIYIRLWGYWRSMNRDLLKKWFDWNINTTPIFSIGKDQGKESLTNIDVEVAKKPTDIEDDLNIEINKTIFWESIDKLKEELTPKQKKLLNMKSSGAKNREILSELKINNKLMKEHLDYIKHRLDKIITQVSKQKGVEINYSELVESLGGA